MADETKDIFTRTQYRKMVAWPERIRREAPFLEGVFEPAPERKLLDVGCGTGEHSRHFAELGWTAVGVDVSESMIGNANDLAGATERFRATTGSVTPPREGSMGLRVRLTSARCVSLQAINLRVLTMMPCRGHMNQATNPDEIATRGVLGSWRGSGCRTGRRRG